MRFYQCFIFLFVCSTLQAQTTAADSVFIEYKTPFRPAIIYLFKNNSRIDSSTVMYARKTYGNLGQGDYRVVFYAEGKPSRRMENIKVEAGQVLRINIKSDGPCVYRYPEGYVAECPRKHLDNIVPIRYGLVRDFHKERPLNEYLGGCLVTDCDPRYYCNTHKIKF